MEWSECALCLYGTWLIVSIDLSAVHTSIIDEDFEATFEVVDATLVKSIGACDLILFIPDV